MPKNIIICCDGTNNQFGKNNTNVAKLYDMTIADAQQLNYYDPGVGTTARNAFAFLQTTSNLARQAFGLDLSKNVEEAYRFLMKSYEPGDKIFLFGFSRGAHTVRRLADVLGKYGLLHSGSNNMIPYVQRMYNREEPDEVRLPFRRKFTRECPVHFLGVWDTVSALSRLMPLSKLDGELNDETHHAYHAVSIDEQRFLFPANLFKPQQNSNLVREEVWFAGVHSDIGGSYKESGLADITLKWMVNKAVGAGLRVYDDVVAEIKPNVEDKMHDSWTPLFWFSPWPLYVVLFLVALALIQVVTSYLGLFWPFFAKGAWCARPFYFVCGLLIQYWYMSLLALAFAIFKTRRTRVIPDGARIHRSVETRIKNSNYLPKSLNRVVQTDQWVD